MSTFATPPEPHDCRTCEHFGGMLNRVNGRCEHPRLSPVVGQPEYGCAYWVRATGGDDEPDASGFVPYKKDCAS